MPQLVLIRHGQSQWNLENRFTGWVDQDLSTQGESEAQAAGQLLREEGFTFDLAFTSRLKRAIRTLWFIQHQMDLCWIPVNRAWELNERHYGALQGLDKAETAARHGDEQVLIWRRSYDTPPPLMDAEDPARPANDPRYADVDPGRLPLGECLKDTVDRVVPYWDDVIKPLVASGKRIIITAHGNSLRAMVKHLDGISDEEIVGLNIPTGAPMVYDFDENMNATGRRYLGDADAIAAAAEAVARQGKSS